MYNTLLDKLLSVYSTLSQTPLLPLQLLPRNRPHITLGGVVRDRLMRLPGVELRGYRVEKEVDRDHGEEEAQLDHLYT